MKREGLLHPLLSATVASLGHGQTLAIGDAGLPVPATTPTIDLGFTPGQPAFVDVVEAVLSELVVESAVVATQLDDGPLRRRLLELLDPAAVHTIDHEAVKARLTDCRAVVRTGEFTPYANVILTAGVAF